MNDFATMEKSIVRELSCRLCLCSDVVNLKPLGADVKRKINKLFDILVRKDDTLPKAICHDCLQQVNAMHLYAVKVERTQKFLDFYKSKNSIDKNTNDKSVFDKNTIEDDEIEQNATDKKKPKDHLENLRPILNAFSEQKIESEKKSILNNKTSASEHQHEDFKEPKYKSKTTKKMRQLDLKYMESMPLEEFMKSENLDKIALISGSSRVRSPQASGVPDVSKSIKKTKTTDFLDPIVLIDGKPAKQGAALDRQVSLFYKMDCCICHENGFHFKSLMQHYKNRHGVPGYVTCCNKKFHFFYPKRIIEHMAYHLQANIFMCPSCHQNFQTSQELHDHQSNGGRSEGKILCPRCSERYPTYRELGCHITSHRAEKQCDYCGKQLKHTHRKRTVNHMEDVILCSKCIGLLKRIEKQDKDSKEKLCMKTPNQLHVQKNKKFRQAMGLSVDDEASTD